MGIAESRRDSHTERVELLKTQTANALSLMDKGYSKVQIAKEMSLSENTVRKLLFAPDELERENQGDSVIPDNDDHEMVLFDRYFSEPEKLAIAKEFVGTMPDALFERYKVLPFERKLHLLRLYAENNHNTNLGISPNTP